MGKIYIVGIGPGEKAQMTGRAIEAMKEADVLCGYTVYVDLVKDIFPGKEIFSTPMLREIERCEWAVSEAEKGRSVAMICSGDAGVYGMAEPVIRLAEGKSIDIEVVAGVTAALSGAAVLGAPMNHDFCVISLSDLLTPWEVIEKRLKAAGMGDFCVCLYNPMSKKRRDHLQRACDILLEEKDKNTICGWVRNIGREGQESKILTLGELRDEEIDMFTTVFIGNMHTHVVDGHMITPRGYEGKYK